MNQDQNVNTSGQSIQKPKKSFCLSGFFIVLGIFIAIFAGNYIYKHYFYTSYVFKHEDKDLFSLKYKKLYSARFTANEKFYPNRIMDDLIIKRSCSPLDTRPDIILFGDCWADMTVRITVSYPNSDGFYENINNYITGKKSDYMSPDKTKLIGGQTFYLPQNGLAVYFSKNYTLEARYYNNGEEILDSIQFYQ